MRILQFNNCNDKIIFLQFWKFLPSPIIFSPSRQDSSSSLIPQNSHSHRLMLKSLNGSGFFSIALLQFLLLYWFQFLWSIIGVLADFRVVSFIEKGAWWVLRLFFYREREPKRQPNHIQDVHWGSKKACTKTVWLWGCSYWTFWACGIQGNTLKVTGS